METKWYVEIAAIAGIVVLQVTNLCTAQIDGVVASSTVGAIVFIVTRQVYKHPKQKEEWPDTPPSSFFKLHKTEP